MFDERPPLDISGGVQGVDVRAGLHPLPARRSASRSADAPYERQAWAEIDAAVTALAVARNAMVLAVVAGVDGPTPAHNAVIAIDAVVASARQWTPARRGDTIHLATASADRLGGGPPALTRRETDVLDGLGRALAPAAIADELGISVGTCRAYIKSLRTKLHARTQLEAVVIAGRMGLIAGRH